MEINGFNLNNDQNLNALDAANIMKTSSDSKLNSSAVEAELGAEYMLDSQDSEAFNQIKKTVAGAHHAGRSAYLQSLKDSISSGNYNVSTTDLVEAMFDDGTVEALTL